MKKYNEDNMPNCNKDYLLTDEPEKGWIKKNPMANNAEYLPIGIVEELLDKMFGEFSVEILRDNVVAGFAYITVRVYYKDSFQDGIAAIYLPKNNPRAIEAIMPLLVSNAIKDAVGHIGRLFGRDLNRKDLIEVESGIDVEKINDEKEKQRIIEYIENAVISQELDFISKETLELYDLFELFNNRYTKLKEKEANGTVKV